LNKGHFSPEGGGRVKKEWSLWKELEMRSLMLVNMLVPGSLDRRKMMKNLSMLPELCANSQRERETAFLSSA
jgi:hypothetical protein